MDVLQIGLILMGLLFLFLGAGLWVALALFAIGVFAIDVFTSAQTGPIIATTAWSSLATWSLAPLPLFIWMGEILFRSRLSEDMFTGLAPWLNKLPGRLLHVNILGCGIFAAVSGSSAATAATIGRMSIPELRKQGYADSLILGTLAGSGTLGLLIPPSIILIVYGVSAELSIARLFIAGVIPGAMLIIMFMSFVGIWATINKDKMPAAEPSIPFAEKIRASGRLIPVILLIAAVIGSIYGGVATPTEAAAFGVVGALILSGLSGSLSKESLLDGIMGATRTSCMICFILAGAAVLTVAMGFTGVPRELAAWIAHMDLSPYALLAALTVFFVVLGCFLDGISVVVLTTSVILPMVQAAGIDLLWFGIYVVLVVEMSQITPPVGFNLFVLQGLTGKNLFKIAVSALPFFFLLLFAALLITVFPGIVTWLPTQMSG
ncbi:MULTISPECIES: TRAP transporter large permease subunit [Thalassospira]|jgi:tripartite ATP-independent transporter DctM subunit|uniref:TRAP transporter large permease protein n=1 Tax=Thalassospira profundimaris TaxID=502049 RepID=A0A367VMN0_9PROT|nr:MULTISPECIES: TRAP transporter large permease subunit [Thalassospira]MBR9899634.1 TRAP transporter large permease subunit [Rhodospirillales bacterium]KZB70680.1 C4-dicarboxylate ABC transporter permease [Thalassospira sp. MCCC 1A01148]MBO6805605.1 TRAP transporter large permease subunit [Thalassospira sp.]MBO6841269.1 TRAP transporter large permease subunit [Thalassospira sp.]MBS8273715.1 C4-dicarboxylate ABC transporter permease [Thalassospira tepidiphila]